MNSIRTEELKIKALVSEILLLQARAYENALLLIHKGHRGDGKRELQLLLEEPVLQAEAGAGVG